MLRFGAESVERMVEWAADNVPSSANPSILEIGSGNGTLLFGLCKAGYPATSLCGIDYSAGAVKLAKSIAGTRGDDVAFHACDFLKEDPPRLPHMEQETTDSWDLALDKGTFDAIALGEKDEQGNSPAKDYPGRIGRLLKPGSYFLITCACHLPRSRLTLALLTFRLSSM
jgi:SAM-dependent methyltransferase